MSPAAEDDIDAGTQTSTMASSDILLHRKFSEPMPHSVSSQSQSPTLLTQGARCSWCGKYLEVPDGDTDGLTHNTVLEQHIATVHPHIAKFSIYNAAVDEQPDELAAESDDAVPVSAEDVETGSGVSAEEIEDSAHDGTMAENTDVEIDGSAHEDGRDLLPDIPCERDTISVDKRLHRFWNIHDPRKFSHNFDDDTAETDKTWNFVFSEAKQSKRRDVPELLERPNPYRNKCVGKGEFLEITSLDKFLVQLRDPELRTASELYAITQNAALTLKCWQDEYMAIDRLQKRATRYTLKPTVNPRKSEAREVFEDKKESALYGYKYDPKSDKIGNQNPFIQGSFKPTSTQMRRITARTGLNNPNPDGWQTIYKFGVEHVLKLQDSPRKAPLPPKVTRKRRAAEIEAASLAEETEYATTATEDLAVDESIPKRRARGRAGNTSDTAPTPARRGATRGRGRGRGGSHVASRTHEAPSVSPSSRIPTPAAEVPTAGTEPLTEQPADAPSDTAEALRRQKIANSKNPKRTEAMLNHWARFNREGRVRNPKRTKAQIEADRIAEAAKKASESSKPVDKRRNTVPIPPLGPAAPVQPAPIPSLVARGPIVSYIPLDPRTVVHPYGQPPGHRLQRPTPPMPYHSPYAEYYMHPYGPPVPPLSGAQRPA